MAVRSLYQCFNARVLGERIHCVKGHILATAKDGTTPVVRLARGQPLELKICQGCPDYDEMGGPVPPEERGWVPAEVHRGRPKRGDKDHA